MSTGAREAVLELPPLPAEAGRLAAIERKLDLLAQSVAALGEQVALLAQKAHDDRRRQREWEELGEDLAPVVRDMYAVAVEQLAEIQSYVQLEDVLALLKRLARNTRSLTEALDMLESLMDFWKDAGPLTREIMDQATATLAEMERKGYFAFARQGQYVAEQIVTSFREEDVRLLGDNVVLILNTVKALTQPEMMNLVNNLTQGFQEAEARPDALPTSLWALAREMRDPDVRRGLALTLAMLKRVSQQHARPAPSLN